MHSRLYTRVLNQYGWVHNCSAISSLYNDHGLFGIFISPESTKVAEAVAVACNELQVCLPSFLPFFLSEGLYNKLLAGATGPPPVFPSSMY